MRDFHSGMNLLQAIGAAVLNADNTPAALDLQGYNGAEILLALGVGGITFDPTNKIEIVVTHSDDDSTYTAVEDKDMLGVSNIVNGIIKTFDAAHPAAANYRWGYVGARRYLKILADFSGTHATGTPIYCGVARGFPNLGPQADQA